MKDVAAIVGVGRGGLIPATLLAYKLNVDVINNFQVQSYKGENVRGEYRLWQAPDEHFISSFVDKNILVVDDLSDRGGTLASIKKFFENRNINALFATLYVKEGTSFMPDVHVRNYEEDNWIVFPWEIES
jgi:xanthine phosphoribosyltransferase